MLILIVCLFACLTFVLGSTQQRPFSTVQQTNKLELKTIYHRTHGPIPGLFRKHKVSSQDYVGVDVRHVLGSFDRPDSADRDALSSLLDKGKQIRWSLLDNVRPMNLESSINHPLPNLSDRATILSLAMISNNAYVDAYINSTEWYDLGEPWSVNDSFGWESDGLRGHVFANKDNSLIVIGFKGTSAGLFTGGPTGDKDKFNDNLLFSCCCGRISRAWSPVCDCYVGNTYTCNSTCLEKSILETEFYYDHALEIYKDVEDQFPDSAIWLTGHSLGGALASMVGQTFGVPTVTFESPGDQLASKRLHLPHSPGINLPIWHFGHTADPIFVGVCTGPASSCWYGGFAMETRCHTSKTCVWDTVGNHGWKVDIRSHRITDVIDRILMKPDDFPLPSCQEETKECQDCGLWEYKDDRDPPEALLLH